MGMDLIKPDIQPAPEPTPFNAEGPQPLLREIPKGADYPADALGPLQVAVEAVQDKTQAPIAIAAQSALSVASLAVQGFAHVETLGGDAPASLFCLTVAASGERKSGCDKLLMAGLREFEQTGYLDYQIDRAKYVTDSRLWEAKEKRLMTEAASGTQKATAALADLDAMPPAPEPPLNPSRTATEPTFEGLIKLFEIANPALGLFTDEGGSFFGGHAMNSDNKLKTMAGLSGLWDGSPINRTRAGDGASTLYGRRLAVHMMVQPIAVRPLLADPMANGQGFLARFLITEPQSNIGFRAWRECNPNSDTALLQFKVKLTGILGTTPPLVEGTRNQLDPSRLALSLGAKAFLQEYYNATETAQRPNADFANVRAYASKSAEQAARISAVLTLWGNLQASEITPEMMVNGITLARFYLGEAKRLADAAIISEETAQAEMLRDWLSNTWAEQEVLPSDVAKHGPNSLRETSKAKLTLSFLTKYGWVVQLPPNSVVRGVSRKLAYRVVRGV